MPDNGPQSPSRRSLFKAAGALAATAAVSGTMSPAAARAVLPQGMGTSGRRTLIRGGAVMTMDAALGNFPKGDVLIEGKTIRQVGANIAAGDAAVIDAEGMVVMPGFIDTHHHLFQTALRSLLANAVLSSAGNPPGAMNYYDTVQLKFAPHYRPRDVYISELFGSLSQIDAGVTTVLDISQIHLSPEHTDAAVSALRDAGRRAVLTHSGGPRGDTTDIRRVHARHFASTDQLLTLAVGSELQDPAGPALWDLGREMRLPIVSHVVGALGVGPIFDQLARARRFGPDNIFIHMTGVSDTAWRAVKDAGSSISMAVPIEMTMRHGIPPILKSLAMGIQPSLSVDVEVTMTADFFTQMRSMMTLQRGLVHEMALSNQRDLPALLTARDVIRFATAEGAKTLKLEDRVGTLTPGKEADIILLDASAINVAPLNNAPGAVVTLMERSNVDTVIVAGKVLKWRGKLVDVDLPRLRGEIEASRDYLFAAANIERDLFRER